MWNHVKHRYKDSNSFSAKTQLQNTLAVVAGYGEGGFASVAASMQHWKNKRFNDMNVLEWIGLNLRDVDIFSLVPQEDPY